MQMTPCAIKYHLLQMLEVLSLVISTCELAKFSSRSIFKMQIPLREVTCPEPITVSSLSGEAGRRGCSEGWRKGPGPGLGQSPRKEDKNIRQT